MTRPTDIKARLLLIITLLVMIYMILGIAAFILGLENSREIPVQSVLNGSLRIIIGTTFFGLVAPRVILFLRKTIADSYNWIRLLTEVATINLSATILGILFYFFLPVLREVDPSIMIGGIVRAAMVTFVLGCIIFTIYEAWMNFYDNYELKLSVQQLEKEQVGLKLTALQQKLDPHFMFNSLNVLSELVHEDSEKADQFIAQFSKLYRYVLEYNEESLVELSAEVDFMNAYLYLLKIRMGESMIVKNELDRPVKGLMIPPLSLQLLVENAIKHNSASVEYPLLVKITNDSTSITVTNTKKERVSSVVSSGLGLSKLRQTYSLLNSPDIQTVDTTELFSVTLPLIKLKE